MKPILSLNSQYYATEDGRIYSVKSARFLSLNKTSNGYLGCSVSINGVEKRKSVHRLVAEAYFGKSDLQVNHKDGNKENNCISNLEYCTISENIKHSFSIGLKSNKGENHPFSKLSDSEAKEIKLLAKEGIKTSVLSKMFGVSQAIISGIKHGYKYTHV